MENEIITKLYSGKCEVKFLGPTEDHPKRHLYYVNGERKRSVTAITGIIDKSGALVPWALEEAAKHLFPILEAGKKITEEDVVRAVFASDAAKEKAADLGTAIHGFCENYINAKLGKGKMPEMPEDGKILTGVTSFLEWESQHKVKFLWAEKVLYSKKHDYMGKADFAAMVDGERCLCDIKSGNGLYSGVRLQTAAYAMADTEESKTKYAGRWAIRVAKETGQEYADRMEMKNKIKLLLGKKGKEVYPYQVFEAKFLDLKGDEMEKDFAAFVHAIKLGDWNSENLYV